VSLGIVFKGPEGIVLAADSRVTLSTEQQAGANKVLSHSTFDNATKLLKINGQEFVGVVTYGLGAVGQKEPRTPHSFIPEFEEELYNGKEKKTRLSVENFSKKLSEFFMNQWTKIMPKNYSGPDIHFLVGGYNSKDPYGKIFEFTIPSKSKPIETNKDVFGVKWGGQLEYTNRLIKGFDPKALQLVKDFLKLSDKQTGDLLNHLEGNLSLPIPYQFLPLQDCVDLSIFLIRTTIQLQTFTVGVRGVGGAIDVATITRTDGFSAIQQKEIIGEGTLK